MHNVAHSTRITHSATAATTVNSTLFPPTVRGVCTLPYSTSSTHHGVPSGLCPSGSECFRIRVLDTTEASLRWFSAEWSAVGMRRLMS